MSERDKEEEGALQQAMKSPKKEEWLRLSDTLVGHSYNLYDTLVDTLAGHSRRTLLWDTLVGNSCRTLLSNTLVEHYCRTLLRDL